MKNLIIFILLIVNLIFINGCKKEGDTTEVTEPKEKAVEIETVEVDETENLIEQLKNYEIVVLEDQGEYHQVRVEYPKFDYEPLDEILSDKQREFEGQIEQAKEFSSEEFRSEGIEEVYSYESNVENVIITDNIVSIYYEGRFYQGGGGFPIKSSLNYDLNNDRIITLDDVLEEHSITLEELADLFAEKLLTDERLYEYHENPELLRAEVEEETKPIESNYSTFTLTDDSITFYGEYYSLFPNAEGIIDIEITWDEVEEYKENKNGKSDTDAVTSRWFYKFGDPVEATNSLKYDDQEYRFTVDLPESWKGKYFVQITKSDFEYFPKEPSKSIVFNMVHDGKYVGYIFSIEVLEGISEEEVKAYYENWPGFEGFIGAGNDVVLIYSRPGEMEAPLYEEPYLEVGNQFSKMVEEDMPKILESLEFY